MPVDRNDIAEREVQVIILISGDNENTPEEAAHHAMRRLHERGEIAGWRVPALDGAEEPPSEIES